MVLAVIVVALPGAVIVKMPPPCPLADGVLLPRIAVRVRVSVPS